VASFFCAAAFKRRYTKSVVRGDSVRDLYAKTLALLGLGVLAGAGALVDYWPIGVNVPDAGSALDLPALARALPVSDQPSVRVVQDGSFRLARRTLTSGRLVSPAVEYTALPVGTPSESGAGQQVGLAAPVARMALAVTPASFESATANDAYEPHLALVASADSVQLQEPVLASATIESDGFITGAFKKTGTSIIRTSVKTGASIYDAVRVVGGAVRKALPN